MSDHPSTDQNEQPNLPLNKVSRRGFLIAITGSALAVAAGCRPNSNIVPTIYAPGSTRMPTHTPDPNQLAATPQPDSAYGAITYDQVKITPVSDLYVTQYDYNRTPEIKIDDWKLTVDGLVENPLMLDYEAIKAFPSFEDMRTLECIGNPVGGNLVGNLRWKGLRMIDLLAQAKVKPEATHVKFECADGYATSVELSWLQQEGTMLAYEMNGEPLTFKHGFPIRISTPGLYGQKMPRWITRLEFIDYYFKGFWESHGWSDVANIQTHAIIQTPSKDYTTQPNNQIAIQGVAMAAPRKITHVDLQIDGGEWMPATLTYGDSPLAWTQWHLLWTVPAAGSYRIGVRATDETGMTQVHEATGIFGNAFPNGTAAIHRLSMKA